VPEFFDSRHAASVGIVCQDDAVLQHVTDATQHMMSQIAYRHPKKTLPLADFMRVEKRSFVMHFFL